MDSHYIFDFPTRIHFGPGVSKTLGQYFQSEGIKRPLFVTDPNLTTQPFFSTLMDAADHSFLFDKIPATPTIQSIDAGKEAFMANNCDAIVGVGGGTAMDAARAISLMIHHPGNLLDYTIENNGESKITAEIPPLITVPTACGTGSEVSRSCDFVDEHKHTIFSPLLLAQAVFADPELSLELPSSITASTGIIALSNCVDAFMANGFHPMCDGIALEGVRLVFKHLPQAVQKGDLDSRAGMMMAAMMGAVAQQKGSGIIHSSAQPLSAQFSTPYGVANAIMLPHGLEFNIPQTPQKFQQLSDAIWSHDFIRSTKDLAETLELPRTLKDIGVEKEDLEKLSSLAFQTPYHSSNPRPVKQKDFMDLYSRALK